MNTEGSSTENSNEMLELPMKTHFLETRFEKSSVENKECRVKKRKVPKCWDDCRRSFNTFKRVCRKRKSIKKFSRDLENISKGARLLKV